MKVRILYVVLIFAPLVSAVGQQVVVRGNFFADSISIGQVVPFSLTASYPRTDQVLFPDSTFSFAPFEISKKQFFPTRTQGDTSYDSTVYFLSTFELDSIQSLKLPVFVSQGKDCVAVYSIAADVALRFRVSALPDSVAAENLPLKTSTAYQKVKWILNYPFLVIGILILAALVGSGWLLFGKRVRKYFAIRRLHRNYEQFIARFGRSLEQLGKEFSVQRAEHALVLWKGYMEDLEAYPYTKSTSREILRRVADTNLGDALRTIDRGIYGGHQASVEPFGFLKEYSYKQFQKREEEVKNG
ncbi:MAG: hypothetical protein SH819_12765 [Cytophagales bacterium]|nr:hypothetical protein [Cytophagales bacterium]